MTNNGKLPGNCQQCTYMYIYQEKLSQNCYQCTMYINRGQYLLAVCYVYNKQAFIVPARKTIDETTGIIIQLYSSSQQDYRTKEKAQVIERESVGDRKRRRGRQKDNTQAIERESVGDIKRKCMCQKDKAQVIEKRKRGRQKDNTQAI